MGMPWIRLGFEGKPENRQERRKKNKNNKCKRRKLFCGYSPSGVKSTEFSALFLATE